MMSQTVSKCADEIMNSELVAIVPGIGTLPWEVPRGVAADALQCCSWSIRGDVAGERIKRGSKGTLLGRIS
jgi:hypothetical protein